MRKFYFLIVLFLTFCLGLNAQIKVQGVPRNDIKISAQKQAKAGDATFTFEDVKYWVGEGTNKAALVVQWNDNKTPDAMVWGYRFDGEKYGVDMILEIAKIDPRFYVLALEGTQYGTAIGGFGFDLDGKGTVGLVKNGNTTYPYYPKDGKVTTSDYDFDLWTNVDANDHWASGWTSKGYWSYWVKEKEGDYGYSGLGASSRVLKDGSWDAWSFAKDFGDYPLADEFVAVEPYEKPTLDFTKGYFIVNEEWFGHTNGSVNYIAPDGTVSYRVYSEVNNNEAFGATTQYGTIYGDKFYFVSKQEKDGGDVNYTPGGRLVVADAKTMKKIAGFDNIGGGDGRSFVGVDKKTGYIGAANGIFLFDIENLKVGEMVEGTGGGSTYTGQIGNMIRSSKYVFAVKQSKGILVIDPKTHTVKTTFEGAYTSVIQTKDGNIWGALGNKMIKIDPFTLETTEIVIPTKTIPNTWGAWNAGSFCASTKENAIYFFPGSGWSSSPTIVKYDVDKGQFNESFATIPEQDNQYKQIPYGAGLRIDPITDNLIVTTTESGYSSHYQKNWVHEIDNQGNLVRTIQLQDYYWFSALPVFPDANAPEIEGLETTYHINTATTIDLKDKVSDKDNLAAAIVKDLEIIENNGIAEISINGKEELVINPLKNGTAKIKLSFNSNGKVVEQNITISTAVLGTNDLSKSTVNIYPNPVENILYIEVKDADKAEIYNITGAKITEKTLQKGKNQIDVSSLQKGVYIIKVNNSTFKVIKK